MEKITHQVNLKEIRNLKKLKIFSKSYDERTFLPLSKYKNQEDNIEGSLFLFFLVLGQEKKTLNYYLSKIILNKASVRLIYIICIFCHFSNQLA